SPDGREMAYTAKDAGRADAWSTDINVYVVPTSGGGATVITGANTGADQNPVYSPDGRYIAYASQRRPGFESDRWRLMLYDRASKSARELLPTWDRNADAYFFAPDMSGVYVNTTDAGREKLYFFTLDRSTAGVKAGSATLLVGEHNNAAFSMSADGKSLAWTRDATDRPAEVYVSDVPPAAKSALTAKQLTHENDALVDRLAVS